MELRAYISSAPIIPGDCHRQELEKRRPVRSAKAEKNMMSTRTATCLVVLLWAAAGWGSPLPQEDPTDVPAQYDSLLSEDSEATTSAVGENEQDEAFTAGQTSQDTTVTMSEENSTSENDTEEEVAASGQGFGRPSPSDDTEAAPQDDSLYPEESEGEGTELESENERKRREESSEGEVLGVDVEEESRVDERGSESTNSSEEESSTNTPPSNPLDEEDQNEAESVEGVKVAAVRSGDAVISEENQETDNEQQETTVEFEDLTEEKAETGVTESGETEPEDPSSESEVDGRRRRRRVPLKEADLENKSLGNDTEQNVNESVKSVALN